MRYAILVAPYIVPILPAGIQFDLVDNKELAPLDELNEAILAEDAKSR